MNEKNTDTTAKKVIQIISDVTGNDVEDIRPETGLEDELLIEEHDFLRIISRINTEFDIELNGRAMFDGSKKAEIVEDLIQEVRDETVWG